MHSTGKKYQHEESFFYQFPVRPFFIPGAQLQQHHRRASVEQVPTRWESPAALNASCGFIYLCAGLNTKSSSRVFFCSWSFTSSTDFSRRWEKVLSRNVTCSNLGGQKARHAIASLHTRLHSNKASFCLYLDQSCRLMIIIPTVEVTSVFFLTCQLNKWFGNVSVGRKTPC